MAASRRQEPSGATPTDVRKQIAARYAAHALAIADALGDKPLCVVTGPRRFGKTTSLLPALARILRGRGKAVHIVNGRDYEEEPFALETLPPGQFDVLIIDEANVLMRTKERMIELLQLLHQKGTAIVSVLTYFAGYEPGALYLATIWREVESTISGQTACVVCLPQMIVEPHIARELLALYSPLMNEEARAQTVAYIAERVPLNPYVLLELAEARSIADVNRIVRSRKETLFQHALSPDEYLRLEQSLEESV